MRIPVPGLFRHHLPSSVLLIVTLAAFFRLWNVPGALQFLGDQGRDALIVSRIFREYNLVFIGPVTSVGNMYLGPLYYYWMVPWLFLSYPSPVGPAYAMAALGILTVILLYELGKKMVGERAALIASGLYAISATTVYYARFSWNPNPAPLVSLLMMYWTMLAWKKNPRYWLLVAVALSVLLQLHYVTLLSAGGAGLIWLAQFFAVKPSQRGIQKGQKISLFSGLWQWGMAAIKIHSELLKYALIGFLIVIASFTPVVLFDIKHQFLNARAFYNLVIKEDSFNRHSLPLSQKFLHNLRETHGRSMHILFEITIGHQRTLNTLLLLGVIILIERRIAFKKSEMMPGEWVVLSWLITGVIGMSMYQSTVFDHYIAYLFPATFLLLGLVLDGLLRGKMIGPALAGCFIIGYVGYNLPRLPLQSTGWTIFDMERTAKTIAERVQPGEKYNLVLLSETGDVDAFNYRYFLEASNKPPVRTEDRGQVSTLFIINEDRKIAKVTDSPIYEIVVFPNKNPAEVYTVPGGPEITVLKKL